MQMMHNNCCMFIEYVRFAGTAKLGGNTLKEFCHPLHTVPQTCGRGVIPTFFAPYLHINRRGESAIKINHSTQPVTIWCTP